MEKKKLENMIHESLDISKDVTSLKFINYEDLFDRSMDEGFGFIINEKIDYLRYFNHKQKEAFKKIFFENSIFSYKYGISIHDEDKVVDTLYSCGCHQLTGVDNLGIVCNNCGKPVTRMEAKRLGWLVLNEMFSVLHPFLLFMLFKEASPIKKPSNTRQQKKKKSAPKELPKSEENENEESSEDSIEDLVKEDEEANDDNMESSQEDTTIIEEKEEAPKKEETKKKKKQKTSKSDEYYSLIEALNINKLDYSWFEILQPDGMKMEEFILKYLKRHKTLLFMYRNNWYTKYIPVISKNYRPLDINEVEIIGDNEIQTGKINTSYMTIAACVNNLNNGSPLENPKSYIEDQLKDLCNHIARIASLLFLEIGKDKYSYIRAEIFGKKYTFSGRLILEPIVDPSITDIDVCQIPVDYFRCTFVNDMLEIGKELKIPPKKLHDLMDIDYMISNEDRELIKNVIFPRVKAPVLYTNREPDIYVTSILAFKVHSLIDEMVLRLPFFINPAMVADYDGDALAVMSFPTVEMRDRIFKTLGIKRALIDTFEMNSNKAIGPNNNMSVLLYKGFSKPIKLKKL